MKMYFDWTKAKLNGLLGGGILFILLICCFFLWFSLLHNPHKELHDKIFTLAEQVHNYYRDRPGYWKLSTETAVQDGLLKDDMLNNYREYDIKIGQGTDGESGLPSDMSFNIAVKNLNKTACISLSEMNVPLNRQLLLMKISIINETGITEFSWGGEHTLPVAKYSARNLCQPLGNTLVWTFQ